MPLSFWTELSASSQAGVAFGAALVILLVLRAFFLRWARSISARTTSTVDDFVLDTLRLPSLFWSAALAIEAALSIAPVPEEVGSALGTGVGILVIFSMTIAISNVASGILNARLRTDTGASAASGIARTLVRGLVLLLGLSAILHSLGVSIGPLLTALGVGGLAVALALQDTLGNLFAGIHILLEKPFAIGHFVRIEDGDEGWVLDIGWRTTRLLTLAEHTVVIPNAKIAGSKIVNMNLPDPTVRVERQLGVSFSSDTATVERVLLDELFKAVRELPQAVTEPAPDVLLEGLGAYALQYTIRFYVKQVAFERVACHLVLTRVYNRLRAEGIEVPFPFQVVQVQSERSP